MDRGAWWATVHGATKSQTWFSNWAWVCTLPTLQWEMNTETILRQKHQLRNAIWRALWHPHPNMKYLSVFLVAINRWWLWLIKQKGSLFKAYPKISKLLGRLVNQTSGLFSGTKPKTSQENWPDERACCRYCFSSHWVLEETWQRHPIQATSVPATPPWTLWEMAPTTAKAENLMHLLLHARAKMEAPLKASTFLSVLIGIA